MLFEVLLSNFIKVGTLKVTFPNGTTKQFGSGYAPKASLVIRTWRTKRRLTFNPALALGEAYMDGDLTPGSGALFDLLDLLALNWAEGVNTSLTKRLKSSDGSSGGLISSTRSKLQDAMLLIITISTAGSTR